MEFRSIEWHKQIANMIDAIGSSAFPDVIIDVINQVVPYNQIVIICYHKGKAPSFWHSKVPEVRKKAVLDQYLNGCYLLDPWFHAAQRNLPQGLYLLQDIAPDDFFVSEFYREYYQAIKIQNEAVFAVKLTDDIQIQISMGLMEDEVSEHTYNNLLAVSPVIFSAAYKHWSKTLNLDPEVSQRAAIIHEHVSHTFKTFGNPVLTDREREVALLIIRGYSFKAIAELLDVAFGTVKVHCKNLYKKLDINSQSELFSLFIDAVNFLEIDVEK